MNILMTIMAWNSVRSRNHIFIVILISVLRLYTAETHVSEYEVKAQLGHSKSVNSVDISINGRYALTGSDDGSVKLWDLRSGKEMRTFKGHSDKVNSVKFSPDSKYAISGSNDKNIILWNIESGEIVNTFTGHNLSVSTVSFSNSGKYIVSGTTGNSWEKHNIKLWDINTGKVVRSINGHTDRVKSVNFSKDDKKIISSSSDETCRIWDCKTGSELKNIKNSTLSAISYDGKYVVSAMPADKDMNGNYIFMLKIWDLETTEIIKSFNSEHSRYICSINFSPDGRYLVTGSGDNTSKVIEIETTSVINTFQAPPSGAVNPEIRSVVFSPDGENVLCSTSDESIFYREAKQGKILHEFLSNIGFVQAATIINNGNNIIYNSHDKTTKIMNKYTGQVLRTFQNNYHAVSLKISNDEKTALVGCVNGTALLWDIESGELIRRLSENNISYWYYSIFSPSGKYVLSTYGNYTKLWDIQTGELIRSIVGYDTRSVNCIIFTSDSKYLIGANPNRSLSVWDVESGKHIRRFEEFDYSKYNLKKETGHSWPVNTADITNDSKYVISGADDNTLKLWDFNTGKVIRTFTGHTDDIRSVAFSPDSKSVVSSSSDNSIKLWDVETGRLLKTFTGHNDVVSNVGFTVDGYSLISSSSDGTIRIWNIETGNHVLFIRNKNDIDWLMMTNDGYWDSSKNGGELVSIVKDMNVWNIDQFAVRNNRPDIILNRLGSVDQELIDHYYSQYVKRLRKLGLTEDQLSTDLHIPETEILNSNIEGKYVLLDFKLSDRKYNLINYNIYVNDVPLFGSYGNKITVQSAEFKEKVELTYGMNKIEISCMNEKGAESYRALTYADYEGEEKGDLYYLGFGVSQYRDNSLNLKYADKDADDLSETFSKLDKAQFDNVYTKTFTNEQATAANIKSAKDFLKNSKPDDTFILFIAGHGVHDTDKEATYYYLTHETDLNDLSNTAADFELIEDLLQGIPPRNKLFLMDTCESGEIEEGVQNTYYASADSRGLKGRGIKVAEKASTEPVKAEKRTYLFEKDRYIYNDLARRSGTIVFSSSKGGELSYEKDDIQNGLFTEAIMKCLTSKEADKDSNGIISTDELRDHVSKAVAASSGDLQHPTVDRDNIYQKFGFGLVEE